MRSIVRSGVGIAALIQVTVAVPVAVGQAADPHACTYLSTSDWLRITGKKDIGNLGPQASKPGETRAGTTECDFLSISMTVTSNMTPAWFARDKTNAAKDTTGKWKVESVSGIGDEAYWMWDPRPGSNRNVGLVIRAGTKRVSIGELSASVEQSKPMLMELARLTMSKLR